MTIARRVRSAQALAEHDPDFIDSDAMRGVRLQIDYLKAELLLQEYGVEHTIVVFGGKRIRDPASARRRAGGKAAMSRYYEMARELGRIVGRCGSSPTDCRVMLVTGGGPGIMEAANRGAHDVGARSIGLNIALPEEQQPNRFVTPELSFQFHYFSTRKLHFLLRARALVAFPGGYGTLDEIFETLNLVQSRTIAPVPVVLIGEAYWRRVFDADFLVDEGMIDAKDRALFSYAESARQAWATIVDWHRASGTPLF